MWVGNTVYLLNRMLMRFKCFIGKAALKFIKQLKRIYYLMNNYAHVLINPPIKLI